MTEQLTKDADRVLCSLYKEYLNRRKAGWSRAEAKDISVSYFRETESFSNMPMDDVLDIMAELQRAGYVEADFNGDGFLRDKTIIEMENRFKNGLTEVLSFLARFIP